LNYLLIRNGLTPESVSVTGIGGAATALAAMERGKVDAAIMTDPALAQLSKRAGPLTILADTRTAEGVRSLCGVESYPASVLYARSEWLAANPGTAGRLARAMKRTLAWMQSHSPREIADRMPVSHRGEDEAVYVEAIRASMPVFSPDGVMAAEGPAAVEKVLSASLSKVREAKVNVARTYTNRFVESR
jgi:NitT/TauT family transport system substrate-binding protein